MNLLIDIDRVWEISWLSKKSQGQMPLSATEELFCGFLDTALRMAKEGKRRETILAIGDLVETVGTLIEEEQGS